MADLRTELAALADKWKFERAGYPVATDLRALAAETAVRLCEDEVRALLASSAPATASEGATEARCTNGTACLGGWGPGCCNWSSTEGTSSDGDRGLSDRERAALDAAACGNCGERTAVLRLVERILAARTAQPEGTERVEWGVRMKDGSVAAIGDFDGAGEFAAFLQPIPGPLPGLPRVRRTVTTYAPVVGPWEVVGDE